MPFLMEELTLQDLYEGQQDILAALNAFAGHVDGRFSEMDKRFSQIDQRFDEVDKRFDEVDQRFEEVDKRFDEVDKRFTRIEATLVTKDYLDDKIADLRGDLVLLARKGNTKLSTLIDRLVEEKSLDPKVAHQILLMEPFPQT